MSHLSRSIAACALALSAALALAPRAASAQSIATTQYTVGPLNLALRRDTQTLARLSPKADASFDFTPGKQLAARAGNGYVHLGDVHLRVRSGSGAGAAWRDFSSARTRQAVRVLAAAAPVLAAADITPSLGSDVPLTVERRWVDDDGALALRFTLINRGTTPVEVGGLGIPMVFDNIITGRSLDQAHTEASFVDPYIGGDGGYVQVTRLNGKGPALLVLPEAGTPLEAYRPILMPKEAPSGDIFTDLTARGQTFEGFYDWTVASAGFAEREWKNGGAPWNPPTRFTIAPGASRTVGVRMVTSDSIRGIERTLASEGRPVVTGIPGFVLPTDLTGHLFIESKQAVSSIDSEPAGVLSAEALPTKNGRAHYALHAQGWGRARLRIRYADGSVQTVSYYVTKPLAQVMDDAGSFATTKQFFDDARDPFKRAPAILSYDRDANTLLSQEARVWIAGMSDEGGAGSWVLAAIKQLDNPDPEQVAKLERVVTETVVGKLQVADGAKKGAVKKSLFYYDPRSFSGYYDARQDWTTWTSWNKQGADDLGRSYNYPHVAIGHWVLYRIARNHPGLVTKHPWQWYLDFAYETAVAMTRDAPYYAKFGQMEGDVFVDILKDLKREGLTTQASNLEKLMKARADHFRSLAYPFGSEMAWDSTGQAEVYAWLRYFGYEPQAATTREVILGYDPLVPHWGYHGNARRYWDFLYGGKIRRVERQLHHYGSALNAVPLFDAFRANPSDLHLLRVAYGGLLGGITNIDQQGFGSAAFHSNPDVLRWDAYTGDYGMGFFGHCYAAATYVVNDATFGWLGFGGDLDEGDGAITVTPKDGARSRLFIAPAGLWVVLHAGKIAAASYEPQSGAVTLTLDAATASTPSARVLIERTTASGKTYTPASGALERGLYTVPLGSAPTTLRLTAR